MRCHTDPLRRVQRADRVAVLAHHRQRLDRPGPELLAPAALLVGDQQRDRVVMGLPLVGAILLVEVGALLARDGVDLGLMGFVEFLSGTVTPAIRAAVSRSFSATPWSITMVRANSFSRGSLPWASASWASSISKRLAMVARRTNSASPSERGTPA